MQVFGSEYAMRIWLDPTRLASYALMPSDVQTAIEAQNTQVSAGKVGDLPAAADQQLTATVKAQSRLQTPEQFRNIILKSDSSGALVRLGDVARIELGNEGLLRQRTPQRPPGGGDRGQAGGGRQRPSAPPSW